MKAETDMLKSKIILLVEDNTSTADLFRCFLERQGMNVTWAANGAEALTELEKKNYDMIIADIEMPIMDGINLCRRVRRHPRYSDVLFLFVTVRKQLRQRVEGLSAGADGFLSKPLHLSELLSTMVTLFRLKERYIKRVTNSSAKDHPGGNGRMKVNSGNKSATKAKENMNSVVEEEGLDFESIAADQSDLFKRGMEAFQAKNFIIAMQIWEKDLKAHPGNSTIRKFLNYARFNFEKHVYSILESKKHIPFRKKEMSDEKIKNLNKDEVYVFSLVNGRSNIGDIYSVSGLGKYKTLNILDHLARENLIGVNSA